MSYIQTEHPSFARETDSNGLVNRDKAGLSRTRTGRKKAVELQTTNEALLNKVAVLNNRLIETESKLDQLHQVVAGLIKTSGQ